jgi:hypothetical protein
VRRAPSLPARLVFAALGLVIGCKDRGREADKPDAASRANAGSQDAAVLAAAVASKRRTAPVHAAPRIKSVSGDIPLLRAGEPLPDHDLVVAPDQELVLDFDAGARVRLFGPSILRSVVTKIDGLLVRDATLSIDLSPASAKPDSGFLLTTPSAAFSLVRSGRLALRSFQNGSTVAYVVSGIVTVSSAGAAFQEALKPLVAGERVEVGLDGSLLRSRHSVQTLEEAEKVVALLPEPKLKEGAFSQLDQALRRRLDELRSDLARTGELVSAHRAALLDGGEQRMELQAQLATQAAKFSRARHRLETALGQRSARGLSTARGSEDPLSSEARALLDPAP